MLRNSLVPKSRNTLLTGARRGWYSHSGNDNGSLSVRLVLNTVCCLHNVAKFHGYCVFFSNFLKTSQYGALFCYPNIFFKWCQAAALTTYSLLREGSTRVTTFKRLYQLGRGDTWEISSKYWQLVITFIDFIKSKTLKFKVPNANFFYT